MVIYDLVCSSGHRFEGWFPGHEAFLLQRKRGLLTCQFCGDRNITKLISGVNIARGQQDARGQDACGQDARGQDAPGQSVQGDSAGSNVAKPPSAATSKQASEITATGQVDGVTLLKVLRHYVTTNFENVGRRFAKMAVEMSRGEVPQKNIYGQVTNEEKEKLAAEEIPCLVLPDVPPEYEN